MGRHRITLGEDTVAKSVPRENRWVVEVICPRVWAEPLRVQLAKAFNCVIDTPHTTTDEDKVVMIVPVPIDVHCVQPQLQQAYAASRNEPGQCGTSANTIAG